MVLDTPAVLAVLLDEPERDEFLDKITTAPRNLISAGTLIETSIVVEVRRADAGSRELELFLHRAGVRTVAVDEDQALLARAAWRRFGTGRHPAGLNFGDLFAYALAGASGDALLFTGDDFTKTDVVRA